MQDIKAKLLAGDATALLLSSKEFSSVIKRDSDRWKKLITEKNIQAE